jgi:hypothetical protein
MKDRAYNRDYGNVLSYDIVGEYFVKPLGAKTAPLTG